MNTSCFSRKRRGKKLRSGAFHLTQMVDYGLFFLATLAKEKSSRSIRSIAREHALSFSFLQKIASLLKQANIVKAMRGKEGGYTLAKNASSITVRDIIEALEGPVALNECLLPVRARARECPRASVCSVRKELTKLNTAITSYTSSKTLAEFISK